MALSLLEIFLVQYIIDRGIKGRLLIRFYDCFTVVNKEDKIKVRASLIVLRNHISRPCFLGLFVCLFVCFLIHCLLDVKDGLYVRYVADLGH